MVNREYKWIHEEVHIEVIIKNNLQELRLDILKSVKYDATYQSISFEIMRYHLLTINNQSECHFIS